MSGRGPVQDEQLREELTVVSGYLSLLLEERDGGAPEPDHWAWLQRASDAAQRALRLCIEADTAAQRAAGEDERPD